MGGCRPRLLSHPQTSASVSCFDLCETKLLLVSKGEPRIGSGVSMAYKVLVEQCPVLKENVGEQASVDVDLIPRLKF